MGAAIMKHWRLLLIAMLLMTGSSIEVVAGQQNPAATVDVGVYNVPEGDEAPSAVPLRLGDDEPCKASGCDGTDPAVTGCIEDAYTQWSVPIVVEGSPVGILELRGSHNVCESTQWAEVHLTEGMEFAARVRQCDTGLATEWAPFSANHEGVARSAQLSSPDYCIWGEFAVANPSGGQEWLIVTVTLPDSEPIA